MQDTGEFTVVPNPAVEGQPVQVHGSSGGIVYWKADGQVEWQELSLDKNGDGSLVPESGTTGVTVSDRRRPRSHTIYVEVYNAQ